MLIENTVDEAQQRYLDIAARAFGVGIDCGLLHSRFTVEDRQRIEDKWVRLYGKDGHLQGERQQRGRILVGTQVLEQSLDIDADFLVSRFAPSDMILQRLGRLWRHQDIERNRYAHQEVWLLVPVLEIAQKDPYTSFGPTAYVYSPYVLCRSLEVWQNYEAVQLPNDIRQIIDKTYYERQEKDFMARWLHELIEGNQIRKGQNALSQLARTTLTQVGPTQSEDKVQTRYSEIEHHEVLLLRNIFYDEQERAGKLILMSGEVVTLPLNKSRMTRYEWRKLTASLMRQVVYVAPSVAPKKSSKMTLRNFGLNNCFYL